MPENAIEPQSVSQSNNSENGSSVIAAAALLVLLVAGTFWQVYQFEFVGYDDPVYVGDYPATKIIQRGVTWEGLTWIWTATAASLWEPLSYLSHMIDVSVWGDWSGGHHLTNLIMHVINTLLVFSLVLQLLKVRKADASLAMPMMSLLAFFAAALFAVHPLKAESVCWVSERKGVQAALFMLLSLVFHIRSFGSSSGTSPNSKPSSSWFLFALVCFVLAMLTKPIAVVTPVLMILIDFWCGRFPKPITSLGDFLSGENIAFQARTKWLLIGLAAAFAALTIYIQMGTNQTKFMGALPLSMRLYIAPSNLMFCLQRTLFPADLSIDYARPSSQLYVLLGVGVAVGSTLACVSRIGELPELFFAWAWFLICWLPVSGIIYVGVSFTSDRYMYLSHVGLAIGIVLLLSRLKPNRIQIAAAIMAPVVGVLAWQCHQQNSAWRSDLTLFKNTIDANPKSALGYQNLGVAYDRRGDQEQAVYWLKESLKVRPSYGAYYNLGQIAMEGGDGAEAKQMFKKCLSVNPAHPQANLFLGQLLLKDGEDSMALEHLGRASAIVGHRNPMVLDALAEALIKLDQRGPAREACQRALSLTFDDENVKEALQEKLERLK